MNDTLKGTLPESGFMRPVPAPSTYSIRLTRKPLRDTGPRPDRSKGRQYELSSQDPHPG